MEPRHNHIYREQQEFKRLMQNFGNQPSPDKMAKLDRMLQGQRERFRQLEQERTRERTRSRGC